MFKRKNPVFPFPPLPPPTTTHRGGGREKGFAAWTLTLNKQYLHKPHQIYNEKYYLSSHNLLPLLFFKCYNCSKVYNPIFVKLICITALRNSYLFLKSWSFCFRKVGQWYKRYFSFCKVCSRCWDGRS